MHNLLVFKLKAHENGDLNKIILKLRCNKNQKSLKAKWKMCDFFCSPPYIV